MPQEVNSPSYQNSRLFDVHRWSEHPQLRELTNRLYEELHPEIPPRSDHPKNKKHLRVLLLDLYHRYLEDPQGWIGLSLNRNDYTGPERYRKLFLTFRPMERMFKLLCEHNYVEWAPGFHDRRTGVGMLTRMKCGERLSDIFGAMRQEVGTAPFNERLSEEYHEELVILRNEQKQDVDYSDTEQTSLMRSRLREYNDFLRGSFIDISLRGWGQPEHIDLTQKSLRRIFNNGSWEQGGRFYGGWWQNCKSELRRRIYISQYKTVEIDYSGLHVVLLYAKKGREYWTADNEDPYLNDRIFRGGCSSASQHKRLRDTMKALFNASLNASSRTKAIQGVRQHTDLSILDEVGVGLSDLLDALARFHAPIGDSLFSGIGTHLQYVDSQITEHVLDRMLLQERLPVLPVHDSYVCAFRDKEKLREAVSDGMDSVLAERGWARVSVRTKEKLGQLYEHPGMDDTGDFGEMDISVILERQDHDLEERKRLWSDTRQQTIVNYQPT
jgi:hypothetical protein